MPLVSVIICVYNAGPFLRESVLSILAQTHARFEVLVVDDGSTDGCVRGIADLADPRLRIFHQPNSGKPAALNRALALARGEFYCQQDADDVSHPRRIERQVAAMQANPELAGVYAGHDLIMAPARRVAPCRQPRDVAEVKARVAQLRSVALDPTGLFRMRLVGGFRYDESLPGVEGIDYMLRVGSTLPMCVLGDVLYSYRVTPNSYTRNRSPLVRMQRLWDAKAKACRERGWVPEEVLGRRPDASTRLRSRDYDNDIASDFAASVKSCTARGMRGEALRAGIACARLRPFDPHYLKPLAYALTPYPVLQHVLRHRSAHRPRMPGAASARQPGSGGEGGA